MALLSQYFVMMCVFVLAVQGEKRLSLGDPDVVNNRLLQMEKEIQRLTAELESNKHDTTNKMASFTAELASQKQQMTSKIIRLEQSSLGKCNVARRVSGITFLRYAQNRKIGKANNFKV